MNEYYDPETDSSVQYPDHRACREWQKEKQGVQEDRFTSSRCYAELGFLCASAYYSPCTPDFDEMGKAIAGKEETCPENFTCESMTWQGDIVSRVCVPVPPAEDYADECETDFDCGWQRLGNGWAKCAGGRCARLIE